MLAIEFSALDMDRILVDKVDTTSPLIETVWSYLPVSSLYLSIQVSYNPSLQGFSKAYSG